MKTCDEMIRDVHSRIAEYEVQKKRRRVRAVVTAAAVTPMIALTVIGAGLLKSGRLFRSNTMTTGSTAAEIEIVTPEAVSQSENGITKTSLSTDNLNDDSRTIKSNAAFSESADCLGYAVIDGEYYQQSGEGEYSPDRYLGKGSDFEGYYANLDISSEFYTAKESEDVVVVLLGNGGQVDLKRIGADEPIHTNMRESEWHGPEQGTTAVSDTNAEKDFSAIRRYCYPEEMTTATETNAGKTASSAVTTDEPSVVCDVFKRAGDPPTEFIKLIRSYPVSAEYCYAAPPDGSCALSVPLTMAMEEYGDSANYLLVLHLFSNQARLFDTADLTAEAKRLADYGYISAIETYTTQEGSSTLLSLNVTYDQIRNFPKEENRSYFLWLYDEVN